MKNKELEINRTQTKALIPEEPLLILPSLAQKIGLNEAIVLQQIHYWIMKSSHIYNGKKWIYNSYTNWQQKNFPFWSTKTIQRAIQNLEKTEILESGNFNKLKIDRTKWYTINYEKIPTLNLSPRLSDVTNRSKSPNQEVNLTPPIPETTTETTTEIKEKELKKEKESFFSNSSSSEPQTQNPKPKNLQTPSLEKNQPQDQDTNPVKTQTPSLEKAPTEPLAEFVNMPQEWLPAYCREILIDLNSKLGTDYKPTPAVKRLIQDRWREGYREIEQYKIVHDNMIQAWYRDPKMKHNLNPTTLYSEKFQNYLNWTKIKTQKTSAVSNEIVYDYNGNPIKPLTSQQRKARDERYEAMKRENEERAYKENCALLERRDKEKQEAQKVLNTLKEKKIEVVSKTLSLSSEDWKTREKRREMQIQQARELIFMENTKKEKVITI